MPLPDASRANLSLKVLASSKVERYSDDMDLITPKAAILQALLQGEKYGLEIIRDLEERTCRRLILAQATVYPALRDLEREGYLLSRESEPLVERGGRARIYYRLTAEGRKAALDARDLVGSVYGLPVAGGAP